MSSRLELRLVVSKAIRRSIIARVAGLMAVGSAFRVADTSIGYSRLWPAGARGAVRIAGPGLGCRSNNMLGPSRMTGPPRMTEAPASRQPPRPPPAATRGRGGRGGARLEPDRHSVLSGKSGAEHV